MVDITGNIHIDIDSSAARQWLRESNGTGFLSQAVTDFLTETLDSIGPGIVTPGDVMWFHPDGNDSVECKVLDVAGDLVVFTYINSKGRLRSKVRHYDRLVDYTRSPINESPDEAVRAHGLSAAIDRVMGFGNFNQGWGDGAGVKVNMAALSSATNFLELLSDANMNLPLSSPLLDGGIHFEWGTKRYPHVDFMNNESISGLDWQSDMVKLEDESERQTFTSVEELVDDIKNMC